MKSFLANTDTILEIPLSDSKGELIEASSALFDVLIESDELQTPLLTGEEVSENLGSAVNVTIPAIANQLPEGSDEAVVRVRVYGETTLGNQYSVNYFYLLQSSSDAGLVVGKNTFQSLSQAELTASKVLRIDAWNSANESEKVAALIAATKNLQKLRYNIESDWRDVIKSIDGSDLGEIDPESFKNLPEKLKAALRIAQVLEADSLLGDGDGEARRLSGITSETVGETRTVYSLGKPIELPVSKRALQSLARYVTFTKRLVRR